MSGSYSSVLWLAQVDKDDSSNVGTKAARLGDLARAGFPISPGFVVTNHAFQHFLHENNLTSRIGALITTIHFEDVTSLMQVSGYIKRLIMEAHVSPELIKDVDASYRKFGGFFHHPAVSVSVSNIKTENAVVFHNVKGEANVIIKIREAWASLFSPPALRARHKANVDHFHEGIAVLVQKMIVPDVSGTIISRNPVTHDSETLLIEAAYGFPDHMNTPDHYTIAKGDVTIVDKRIAKQDRMLQRVDDKIQKVAVQPKHLHSQKLTDNKILELAVLAKKLEKQYYFPQVISWVMEKNTLYITGAKQLDPVPHHKPHEHAQPSTYLPLLLKATPASPGLRKGPVRVVRNAKELVYVSSGDILVTPHTGPEFIPVMKKAAAIITEQGGRVSQAAHVSREIGIPAIIGAQDATKILHSGTIVTVNGTTGEVYGGSVHSNPHNGISTATKLYVNITKPAHAETISREHVDGVGFLHSDVLQHEIGVHPQKLFNEGHENIYAEKLANQLESVCKSFAPRPVAFGFTDLQTSQLRLLDGGKLYEPVEPNPQIGYRGAYRLIHNARLFALELQAIKKIRNNNVNNIWMSVPFVRTIRELDEVKRMMAAAGLHRTPTLKLWMQVSTPANLISLDSFIMAGIDGIMIDMDTLVSLVLGADKQNSDIVKEFNPHDPAVLWLLEQAIKICHKHHTQVIIGGQTPSQYPALIEKLVHWGVTAISIEPNVIHTARKNIQDAEKSRILNASKN